MSAINPDGTATCTLCGTKLPGYGVIYGVLINDLDPVNHGLTRSMIFCYANNCNNKVLTGKINHL